jgi:acetate---CoA ligase (ADP-forming)
MPDASPVPAAPVTRDLERLFRPRSIALIGVSADRHKLNGIPFWHLRRHGFAGSIHLVNPKYDQIDGVPCHKRVDDLPQGIDAALVMVPAKDVPEAIRACGRRGVGNAVILSSGFEEVEGGAALVADLRAAALEGGVTLVGPNCEGIWSIGAKTILTFGSAADRDRVHHGNAAIISQSGSIGGAVVRQLQDSGFGCAYFVSVGNETLVDAIDYLDWLVEQPDVRVALLFVEGLTQGERLPAVAAKARARGVHLVALKSGASAAGLVATASHTGKVAAPFRVYRDLLAACGIVQVDSIAELVEAAEVLGSLPLPPKVPGSKPGIGVFSLPGGTRALTADAAERRAVPLATFEESTVEALKARLPKFGYPRNPTDITGQVLSDPALFTDCLTLVADEPNVEATVVQFANRGPRDAKRWHATLRDVAKASRRPMVLSFLADTLPADERLGFARDGIACARDPADAVKYLSWLYRAREAAALPVPQPKPVRPVSLPDQDDLSGWAALLADAGIAMPRWRLLGPADDPVRRAEGLQFPLAAKALPSASDHKTEAGLLKLNLRDSKALAEGVTQVRRRLPAGAPVILQEMVPGGIEVVLSVTRNADFGPVLGIGAGGVMIELMEEIAFLQPPFDAAAVERALRRLKLATQLAGFRGAPPADAAALAKAAVGLMALFQGAGDSLQELELNPVFVLPAGEGVVAVDLLVKEGAKHG